MVIYYLRIVVFIHRQVLNKIIGIAQFRESHAPVRRIFARKGPTNAITVKTFSRAFNAQRHEPSVEVEAPLSLILKIFIRHIAIQARHVNVDARLIR